MSDVADDAAGQEEMFRQVALFARHKTGPQFSGRCLNCGAEVKAPFRWCDAECREDWCKREDE